MWVVSGEVLAGIELWGGGGGNSAVWQPELFFCAE